ADTFGSVVLYRLTIAPIRYSDFFLLRGASYLPSLLNHHLGQAILTYFLSRTYDVKLVRAAGATLLSYAAGAACILSFGTLALACGGRPTWLAVWVGLRLGYLGVLQARPRWLARCSPLAPRFETGVVGDLVALPARGPPFGVLFIGHWAPFEVLDIHIP